MSKNTWFYSVSIVIGIVIGIGALNTSLFSSSPSQTHGGDILSLVAPPQSLEALLDSSPLIFIGEVGPVTQYLDFYGYRKDGSLMGYPVEPFDQTRGGIATDIKLGGVPATDLELYVNEVLRDDGTIVSRKPITLRLLGFVNAEVRERSQNGEFPASFTGDRHLFLLAQNPDGTYTLPYHSWSRLNVNGNELRVSNGERKRLQFDDEIVTLEKLRQAIARHR
jgi:hypothetical protein